MVQSQGVPVSFNVFDSPVGDVLLSFSGKGLGSVEFSSFPRSMRTRAAASPFVALAREELTEFFLGGASPSLTPLDWGDMSSFRFAVLSALREVPYGSTVTYAELADAAGFPRAVRAVGTVCASNPFPLFVPCHRVVRSDGSVGGFLGGEDVKRFLLDLEARFS